MKRPFSKDEMIEKSLGHSIKDGVSFSIMGGVGESYFSAYAIFLKATAPQIGLLASVPPLLASFAQMFSVWLGQVTGQRRAIIVSGALLQVVALLCIALLPHQLPAWPFSALLISVVIYLAGPNLGAPQWGSQMGAIIPEAIRGRFFARRTRLSSMASFSALIAGGLILQLFASIGYTWQGFLTIFGIGMCARSVPGVSPPGTLTRSMTRRGRRSRPRRTSATAFLLSNCYGRIRIFYVSRYFLPACSRRLRCLARSSPSTCCATCTTPTFSSCATPAPRSLCNSWC